MSPGLAANLGECRYRTHVRVSVALANLSLHQTHVRAARLSRSLRRPLLWAGMVVCALASSFKAHAFVFGRSSCAAPLEACPFIFTSFPGVLPSLHGTECGMRTVVCRADLYSLRHATSERRPAGLARRCDRAIPDRCSAVCSLLPPVAKADLQVHVAPGRTGLALDRRH